jgi:hypothetical protein
MDTAPDRSGRSIYAFILNPHLMIQHYPSLSGLRRLPRLLTAGLALLVGTTGNVQAQMPANLDFGMNNFTNWKCWTGYSNSGTAATGPVFGTPTLSGPLGGAPPGPMSTGKSRHAITSGTSTDYYGGFSIVCPSGGSYSARVGTDSPYSAAQRIQYYVHVPATSTSYNLQCQYAIVLQDGAHTPDAQSSFQLIAYDSATGAVIPAANNLYIAKWAIPGFSPYINPSTSAVDSMIAWLPWTPTTINLSGMAGKTVLLECTSYSCAYGGHWGYGYLDVTSAQDSLMASLISYNTAGDSATLLAPPGYKNYRWYNQNFSTVFNAPNDAARQKKLPLPTAGPEYYNLVITPYASIGVADTIRTPILKAKKLGVSSALLSGVRVYPNPATTALYLSFPGQFEGTVSLINSIGENVYNKSLQKATTYEISTAGFAAGIYTLVLKDAQGASESRQISIRQ